MRTKGSSRANIADFWLHVSDADMDSPNSCWEWNGSFDSAGYPMYCGVAARRISAVIDTGDIPGNVSMNCENPKCVNPNHFYRIGKPERKNSKTGKIPHRHDIRLQAAVYAERSKSDEELATRFTVTTRTIKNIRYSIALYFIQDEVRRRKANGLRIMREPLGSTIEFKT